MNKIDGELLQKYYAGRCTPKEEKMVQAWLESGESDEKLDLPDEIKSAHKEQMWQNITAGIGRPAAATNVTTLYKKVIRYAAAACVAIGLFVGGYYYGIENADTRNKTMAIADKHANQLHISATSDKVAKIDGDQFQIRYDGHLQLYTAANSEMTIYIGEKSYVLQPMQSYYLTGSSENPNIIDGRKLSPDESMVFNRMNKGNFSIHRI